MSHKPKTSPSLLRLLSLPAGLLAAEVAHAQTAASTVTRPEAIEVTVETDAVSPLDQIGRTAITRDEVKRQTPGSGDLNQLAQIIPGVQFDNAAGSLSEDGILNLRPSRISIAGLQPYANSFLVDGISTSSQRDSTSNDNMHHYIEVVGHPQTTFLNPNLVDSVTFFTNDIPAEYGNFTGGVVSAKLRDPLGAFRTEIAASYTADRLTHYIVADEDRSSPMPEKESFYKATVDYSLDLPLSAKTSALVGYSRSIAKLEESQHHASYGIFDHSARTTTENVTFKLLHKLDDRTKLRFTSLYTPYEQQNYEQSLKLQFNDAWNNKLQFTRDTDRTSLDVHVAAAWSDTSREQEPNLYTYRNFGANDSITWVADTNSSAIRGGFGDINSTQLDLPVSAKFTWRVTETGTLAIGADYTSTNAHYQRPEDASAYRHQSTPSAMNPLVVSGDGADDLTVITGEQALNYRILYKAFDAHVKLNAGDAWVQWSDRGKLLNMPWSYRVGLRYDANDFLKSNEIAPRTSATLTPLSWLMVHAGWNRYYSNSFLSYALREQYPDSYIYTRTGRSANGKLVYYASDWTLYSHSRTAGYAESGAKTPYSDELSFGTTLDLHRFGQLKATYSERRARDEFSRDDGTRETYINEKTGATGTRTVYRITNDGYTNSESFNLTWQKNWDHHRVSIGTSFSDVETTTADYLSDSYAEEAEELVYYKGRIVTAKELGLERDNYARPRYVTFKWSSDWFKRRVTVDVLGRWNTSYTFIEDSGYSYSVGGVSYALYQDVDVPSGLVNDLNIGWRAWETKRTALTFETKISNVFDRLPYSSGASTSNPYQQGRTVWLRTSLAF